MCKELTKVTLWFSCGAASATATHLFLKEYGERFDCNIVRIIIGNEHEDNERFTRDCEAWYGRSIVRLRNEEYADCWDVWNRRRFLVGPYGAACTTVLKTQVREAYNRENPAIYSFGYTLDELARVERFKRNNPYMKFFAPLISNGFTKNDCYRYVIRAGIELPMMYRLGFNNNNCVGCVKGGGGYWNKIRKHFPEVFERMARLERELGVSVLMRNKQKLYLDELPGTFGRYPSLKLNKL